MDHHKYFSTHEWVLDIFVMLPSIELQLNTKDIPSLVEIRLEGLVILYNNIFNNNVH